MAEQKVGGAQQVRELTTVIAFASSGSRPDIDPCLIGNISFFVRCGIYLSCHSGLKKAMKVRLLVCGREWGGGAHDVFPPRSLTKRRRNNHLGNRNDWGPWRRLSKRASE